MNKKGCYRTVILPEKGIFTDDSLLFHHVGPGGKLTSEMIERLRQHGVALTSSMFNKEEDEIIRKNWKDYSEEFNIPYSDVLAYIGVGDARRERVEIQKRRYSCVVNNFWPRMCKGLPHRSAQTLHRRMRWLFDPIVMKGQGCLQYNKRMPFTYRDLISFAMTYNLLNSQQLAAEKIDRTLMLCQSNYMKLQRYIGTLERQKYKMLWNLVISNTRVPFCETSFKTEIKRAIREPNLPRAYKLEKHIDFQRLCVVTNIPHLNIKKAWEVLIELLIWEYGTAHSKIPSKKAAMTETYRVVFNPVAHISATKFCIYLRLLIKCVNKEVTSKHLKAKHCRFDRLPKEMLQYGITGFHVDDPIQTEDDYLFGEIKKTLRTANELVFVYLVREYTLKERVKIISLAYETTSTIFLRNWKRQKAAHDTHRRHGQL